MLPKAKALTVRSWPQHQPLAVQDVRSAKALTVISVMTPVIPCRMSARVLLREALCQTLGEVLGQPAGSVKLASQPGEAIEMVSLPGCPDLSLSHAPGLSIASICRGAKVGVDLMRIEDGVASDPDWVRVARDYLGPQVTALLLTTPLAECSVEFVKAWTRFEASLKCLGIALTEWSPELDKQLTACHVVTLDFDKIYSGSHAIVGNYFGSVAVDRSL
jgi:4'-phosphopantetheinyl transferase